MTGPLDSKALRRKTHFLHVRTSLSKRFERIGRARHLAFTEPLLALVDVAEGAGAGAYVTGEELPEVGGVGKTQTAGDGRHRLIRVRRQSLHLQRDTGIDHMLHRLSGGSHARTGV